MQIPEKVRENRSLDGNIFQVIPNLLRCLYQEVTIFQTNKMQRNIIQVAKFAYPIENPLNSYIFQTKLGKIF